MLLLVVLVPNFEILSISEKKLVAFDTDIENKNSYIYYCFL